MNIRLGPLFAFACAALVAGCEEQEHASAGTATKVSGSGHVVTQDDVDSLTGDVGFSTLMSYWKASFTSEDDFYNAARKYFNCYAYASGSTGSPYNEQSEFTMSIPGASSGQPMQLFTAAEMDKAVVADGYVRQNVDISNLASTEVLKRDGYKLVAAFIDPSIDDGSGLSFHFALRGDDGVWRHKNGMGEVKDSGFFGEPLRDPHLYPADYLGEDYHFAGYYWRPDEGIEVTGGAPPVAAFFNNGTVVEEGLFNPEQMRSDIRIGTRSDYLLTSVAIDRLEVEKEGDDYTVTLNERVRITLPHDMVFSRGEGDADPSGYDTFEIVDVDGNVSVAEIKRNGAVSIEHIKIGAPRTFPAFSK